MQASTPTGIAAPRHAGNVAVAAKLREMAAVLEQQAADGFRVAAYRRAAEVIESLARPVEDIVRTEGAKGLDALPGIGRSIAAAIVEMVVTGRWLQLERLLGTLEPEQLLQTIPGIGPGLAARLTETLHVESLEALEVAAHDGRLAKVPGIGERRAAAIRAALAERLGSRHVRVRHAAKTPPIALLLEVDAEYRDKAAKGLLRTIAPKRFNPKGEAWLPVLHVERGGWTMTALFSNTQKAHELGRTRDWVVIYFHTDDGIESQCTVVTETHGPLTGRRVVRGREGDCAAHYAARGAA
jgi:hypothetical protein